MASEAEIEAGTVWRCATADMVAAFDVAFTHPLKNSRRKAERDLGEKIDGMMEELFRASRNMSPGHYSEAVTAGKELIAIAKGVPARAATMGGSDD